MDDGFVKEPAVITRKDFNPAGMSPEEIERLKLEDGVRLHESVKVQLETYARENARDIVKPFVLVIARDTTHAKKLLDLIQSEDFFKGAYKDKVIQVDSSKTGAEEEEMISGLLKVEHSDEPTEIVNALGNIAVIGPEINIRISAKDPMKYIAKYEISDEKLSQQFIDPASISLSQEGYKTWVHGRAQRLAEVANDFFAEIAPLTAGDFGDGESPLKLEESYS